MTAKSIRPILGKNSTRQWFQSEHARPKTIQVTFERTVDGGYQIDQAFIENQINQHTTDWVRADVRALARDMRDRGISVR